AAVSGLVGRVGLVRTSVLVVATACGEDEAGGQRGYERSERPVFPPLHFDASLRISDRRDDRFASLSCMTIGTADVSYPRSSSVAIPMNLLRTSRGYVGTRRSGWSSRSELGSCSSASLMITSRRFPERVR